MFQPHDRDQLLFILGKPLSLEESISCEFKEVRGQNPVQQIGKIVDEYVVAYLNETPGSIYWGIRDRDRTVVGVRLSDRMRDELRQVVGQKIAAIAPPVPPESYNFPLHPVQAAQQTAAIVEDLFVVEARICGPKDGGLYLTGSGEAYRKTLGGIKKLTGAELLAALFGQLEAKTKSSVASTDGKDMDISWMPSVARRAKIVRPLLIGARILWVDDQPGNNLYERTVLSSLGVSIDLALSTDEALYMIGHLRYDLILSDMKREGSHTAGLELLEQLSRPEFAPPIIFYMGQVDRRLSAPIGAFGMTDRPDELLHYAFDVLERRELAVP